MKELVLNRSCLIDGFPAKILRGFAVACAVLTVGAQDAAFISRPEETEALRFEPYLQLELENTLLSFMSVSDSRGKALGNLAIETGPSGDPSKLVEAAQYFRSPTDLARALTLPGKGVSKIPTFPEGNGTTDCEASWPGFRNEVLSFGYGLSFLSESDGPSAGTGHWWVSDGFSVGFYELHGRADDVSAFFVKIQFCYEDPIAPPLQGNDGSSVDPEVFFYFRTANGLWTLVNGGYYLEPGEQINFWWHPVSEPIPGYPASQLDFKVNLYDAAADDRFHIGATWSKPFDTFTQN